MKAVVSGVVGRALAWTDDVSLCLFPSVARRAPEPCDRHGAAQLFASSGDWVFLHSASQAEVQAELDAAHAGVQMLQVTLMLADAEASEGAVVLGIKDFERIAARDSALDRAERVLLAHPMTTPLDPALAIERYARSGATAPSFLLGLAARQQAVSALRAAFERRIAPARDLYASKVLLRAEARLVKEGVWRSQVEAIVGRERRESIVEQAATFLQKRCMQWADRDARAEVPTRKKRSRDRELTTRTDGVSDATTVEFPQNQPHDEQTGSTDGAMLALERRLAANERDAEVRERLRQLYEAAEVWQKLADLLARDGELATGADAQVEFLRQAARVHADKRGDHVAAAAVLEQASQIKPDNRELLLDLCDEYNASGRGGSAAAVLEKIVQGFGDKRAKELAEVHRRLASTYLAEGEAERALEELDRAFRMEPGNVSVLALLGEVALDFGDLRKAQQMYRALLLQKLEDGGPIKKSTVLLRLGDTYERLGERPKAVQMYERALQSDASLQEAESKLAALKR